MYRLSIGDIPFLIPPPREGIERKRERRTAESNRPLGKVFPRSESHVLTDILVRLLYAPDGIVYVLFKLRSRRIKLRLSSGKSLHVIHPLSPRSPAWCLDALAGLRLRTLIKGSSRFAIIFPLAKA